jgi:hypothetical protein
MLGSLTEAGKAIEFKEVLIFLIVFSLHQHFIKLHKVLFEVKSLVPQQ